MLVSSDNSTVVTKINKEGGTHSFEMCALMWRILAWSNAREIHIRARHIPGNLNVIADSLSRRDRGHSDRVVSASSDFSRNLPSLAQANGGSVCHQLECQTSNLRISCPRQGLADRCVEHLLGGSGCLCFLSSGHPAPVSSENYHLQVQGHCHSTRVAGDALVLGSGGIVSQDSTEASSSAQSPEATLQSQIPQESGVSESSCVVSGLLQEGQGRFSVEVADRIKAPQRKSSRRVYDSRWAIPQIADLFIIFSLIRT